MTIEAKGIGKQFGEPPTIVLRDISLSISDGEFVAIWGRSGSGKTTLLYILSTLDLPSEGTVSIDGQDTRQITQSRLHKLRNGNIGFIFQFHYLLPELSAVENILLPARKAGKHFELSDRAQHLLESFGLGDKAQRLPSQLSGGEQQRVAIARALIMEPKYIFADEPTGNLDTKNGRIVMESLKKVNLEHKTTIVLVTHEESYAAIATRQIFLEDGRLASRT
jgi:lipoprotein-releasing system ATP-binding protein